jgi:hypothetical protein
MMKSSKRSIKHWIVVLIILASGVFASQATVTSVSASLCPDVNWGSGPTVNWGSTVCE